MSNEHSRSRQPHKAEEMVRAALEIIADGGGLLNLGVSLAEISKRTLIPARSVSHYFGKTATASSLCAALLREYRELLMIESRTNLEHYQMGFNVLETAGSSATPDQVRPLLAGALGLDLGDYLVGSAPTPDRQGRERLFYLMIALCDLPAERTGVDYAQGLAKVRADTQALYGEIYARACKLLGRSFVVDLETTQRSINCYLEGVVLANRVGDAPSLEEVVDIALAIFYATTKPSSEENTVAEGLARI